MLDMAWRAPISWRNTGFPLSGRLKVSSEVPTISVFGVKCSLRTTFHYKSDRLKSSK